MTIITGKARKLKKRLLRKYRRIGSWRILAKQYPPVKFGTLQRFVMDAEYMPVDMKILIALGLRKPPKPKTKCLFDMSGKELLWRIEHREFMI